jgi:photosystem II stability/assembly factor-like uncharacterized protein
MSRLYAATGDAVAVISGENGSWAAHLGLPESGAQCVASDPGNPEVAYAGSRGAGLWRSTDGGGSWSDCELPEEDVFSIAVSAADGAVYAGCEPSALFRSRDRGESWTSHVRWVAPSPHDPDRLLVGIELGGVMLSEDGGASWLDHRPGAQRDCHALAWHPGATGRAYEAGGGGAAWSFDGGESWRAADEGRDRHYVWALAVDPDEPDRWYVSASSGPRRAHGRGNPDAEIYRWQGDGPWERLGGGLPEPLEAMPYALAFVDGGLFAGFTDGTMYRSGDRGESWERLTLDGDPLEVVMALAGAPSEDG